MKGILGKAPRVLLGVVVSLVVAVGCALALAPIANADSSCADGRVCFWAQIDYDGFKNACTDVCTINEWLFLDGTDRSAKNRFGQRIVRIGNRQGDNFDVLECLSPGDNDHNMPLAADVFKIGQVGSNCSN